MQEENVNINMAHEKKTRYFINKTLVNKIRKQTKKEAEYLTLPL